MPTSLRNSTLNRLEAASPCPIIKFKRLIKIFLLSVINSHVLIYIFALTKDNILLLRPKTVSAKIWKENASPVEDESIEVRE